MTEPEPLQQIDRTYVRFRGRRLSYFSGCDYFRLASHPRVAAALETGVRRYGLNVAASRMTSGNHSLYLDLEAELARFFGAESALLVPSGYLADLVAAQALTGEFSHALIDESAHAALVDASSMLACPVLRFKHCDTDDLARVARRCGPGSKIIVLTDGLFSRDGQVAPLRDYAGALPEDALLLVDDAHGAAVLGKTGKGTLEHTGVGRARVLQTVTLSKGFGVYGGAVLGPKKFRRRIIDRSHVFIGSTPLPLPLANAALESVRVLRSDKTLRRRLAENLAYVRGCLHPAGEAPHDFSGPALTLSPQNQQTVRAVKRALLSCRIYPPHIRYPGGPALGYFRFVISSEHTRAQLDLLVQALTEFRSHLR